MLNPNGLRDYARQLAEKVTEVFRQDKFPIVLGGDCSNVIGCMLALRRMGRYGLFSSTVTLISIRRRQSPKAKLLQWIWQSSPGEVQIF